ncbi:YhcH/YjgK/YiaL family protein [uncultured Mucilaginibacter sp.]|uniref:YhcH/YjgK/YiaL family protein n=1 Tax=uncultured Mucilaginibacter sp. TaxID=797541 RepID=UPI0025F6C7A0|nr:YhcH/YjgK/YiaL family protein [uncultured Mucilaginibacter sp.]
MNLSNSNKVSLLFILMITGSLLFAQQPDAATAVKKASKWVKSRVWAPELKIKPDKSVNSIEFKKQYESNKPLWDKVFSFLSDSKLSTLAPGRYPVDGDNAYATISAGPPKNIDDVKWEAHQKYIDLHYVINGKVKLGVCPLSLAQLTEPYDDKKDAAHYNAEGKYYTATPQNFFLFFPTDVHRPDIKVKGFDTLKKLVIKIRYQQ